MEEFQKKVVSFAEAVAADRTEEADQAAIAVMMLAAQEALTEARSVWERIHLPANRPDKTGAPNKDTRRQAG